MQPQPETDVVLVESLKLAAFLRLNGERVIRRSLQTDHRIAYFFARSATIEELIERWRARSKGDVALSRFASLVSYEIRTALKIRRTSGLPPRLSGVDESRRRPSAEDEHYRRW